MGKGINGLPDGKWQLLSVPAIQETRVCHRFREERNHISAVAQVSLRPRSYQFAIVQLVKIPFTVTKS